MGRLSGFLNIVHALRLPNYGIYMAGNSISMVGMWMQRVAVGWLAWELTGSAAWLGAIAFADLFPVVLIGPIGGSAADRWDRLRLTKLNQFLLLLQAVILFVLTLSNLITIESLFILTLVLGIITAFQQPIRLALVPSLVPREYLPTAVALNSISFNLARFIGPAIAGVIIITMGTSTAFVMNALTLFLFLAVLSRVRVKGFNSENRRQYSGLIPEFGEGVKYVISHKGIAPVLFLMIIVCIGIRPFQELLPGFADRVFAGGADILALLNCTVGIGAVVGGLWLAQRNDSNDLTRLILITTVIQSLSIFVFVGTDSLWVALPALGVVGFGMVVCGVGVQTLMQLSVDASMRGRVLSIFGLTFRGIPAIGALMMGIVSDGIGLRWPLAFGGFIVILAWGWAYNRLR